MIALTLAAVAAVARLLHALFRRRHRTDAMEDATSATRSASPDD